MRAADRAGETFQARFERRWGHLTHPRVRALAWQGVEDVVAGRDATRLATVAKLKAGRLTRDVSTACLQVWGGMGYMNDSLISRLFRDMRLSSIGGGADEVMLQILT